MANYDINYNDQRFTQVEADKNVALNDLEQTYSGMIDKSDQYYQNLIDANKEWADRQEQLQQEKTDFAIEKIEQQKAQAQKDYTKEQSGAYVDWQKQSNQYGANAEQMAAQGMAGTGYSESSQVSMYTTYQNRVATAREAFQNATLNYNNAITEARLQNNSLLAEIAFNAYQQQLELSLQGFQYKNQLILDKTAKKLEVDQMYYSRYQDVLAQINHENAMAEQIRQFNANQALEQQKMAEQIRQYNASLAEEQRQFNESLAWDKEQAAKKAASGSVTQYVIDKGDDAAVKKTDSSKAQAAPVGSAANPGYRTTSNTSKGTTSNSFTGTTYSEAVAYMKKNGVDNAQASGVLTQREWQRRKASGSTSAQVANYSSYTAYLKDYCQYAIG